MAQKRSLADAGIDPERSDGGNSGRSSDRSQPRRQPNETEAGDELGEISPAENESVETPHRENTGKSLEELTATELQTLSNAKLRKIVIDHCSTLKIKPGISQRSNRARLLARAQELKENDSDAQIVRSPGRNSGGDAHEDGQRNGSSSSRTIADLSEHEIKTMQNNQIRAAITAFCNEHGLTLNISQRTGRRGLIARAIQLKRNDDAGGGGHQGRQPRPQRKFQDLASHERRGVPSRQAAQVHERNAGDRIMPVISHDGNRNRHRPSPLSQTRRPAAERLPKDPFPVSRRNSQINQRNGIDALYELSDLSKIEILSIGHEDPEWLASLLQECAIENPSLEPARFNSTDLRELVSVATAYKQQIEEQLDESTQIGRTTPSGPYGRTSTPREVMNVQPQRGNSTNFRRAVSFDINEKTYHKRVGGVPFGNAAMDAMEYGDDAQDFFRGRGSAHLITPAQVMPYPGRNILRPTLLCDRLFGPAILNGFIASGMNVEQYVRQISWAKIDNGRRINSAEAEAVNLARVIHLTILEAESVQRALENSCGMEIMLRRLWCLLKVEQMVTSENYTRAQAWTAVQFVLEHNPLSVLQTTAVDSYVRRELSALSRFHTAALKKRDRPSEE